MGDGISAGIRKNNYERGLKHGDKVYCGRDLADVIGMRVADVQSNDIDSNVVMWLEDDVKQVAIYFDDMCFDGEHMSIVDHTDTDNPVMLRPVTEKDLKEISNMAHYYDIDIVDGGNEKIGINHMYCNNVALESTEEFVVKGLHVFYDGRIMTEKEAVDE